MEVDHRQLGIDLFNSTWTLMEKPDRTPAEDALMIHMAHASAYHRLQVGAPENTARSHWQCSRVYTLLGRAEPALYHARLVLDVCERHGIGDFDLAFAYEALARAFAVAGNSAESASWLGRARAASAGIADDEDRQTLLSDLATIPSGSEPLIGGRLDRGAVLRMDLGEPDGVDIAAELARDRDGER
jgi:hypothetical protein